MTSQETWKLIMSFPWLGYSSREESRCLFEQGRIDVCGLGSPRRILTDTVPCALNSALHRDHDPAVGSAPGAPGINPNPNPTPNPDPPPKPKPASIPNPAVEPTLAWALT